jgi:hypothetical protein
MAWKYWHQLPQKVLEDRPQAGALSQPGIRVGVSFGIGDDAGNKNVQNYQTVHRRSDVKRTGFVGSHDQEVHAPLSTGDEETGISQGLFSAIARHALNENYGLRAIADTLSRRGHRASQGNRRPAASLSRSPKTL